MGIQEKIMDLAINKYLGSESQWCTDDYAKKADGESAEAGSAEAVSHCAVGSLWAAGIELYRRGDVFTYPLHTHAAESRIEQILAEQHPEFRQANPDGKVSLPLFNDGAGEAHLVQLPSVGYQGIRAAFEKYYAECQEKGL